MLKKFLALSLLVAAAFAETAYFEVQDKTEKTFVVQLTEDDQIKHARELVSGATTDNPHISGRIKKQTASYNPSWSYSLDPSTIQFFNYAIEVCDATFSYTEEYLDEAGGAFLPGLVFCPWTSKVVKEVKA